VVKDMYDGVILKVRTIGGETKPFSYHHMPTPMIIIKSLSLINDG